MAKKGQKVEFSSQHPFSPPLFLMVIFSSFFLFNLKVSHLPVTQKTRELSEKPVPVLAEQLSCVCVRGEGVTEVGGQQ